MGVTRLDWTVRFDRRQVGGRYIRLVWWRLNLGLEAEAVDRRL